MCKFPSPRLKDSSSWSPAIDWAFTHRLEMMVHTTPELRNAIPISHLRFKVLILKLRFERWVRILVSITTCLPVWKFDVDGRWLKGLGMLRLSLVTLLVKKGLLRLRQG